MHRFFRYHYVTDKTIRHVEGKFLRNQ
jgi:hypothetical protein